MKKRNFTIDILKVIAIIGVIYLHSINFSISNSVIEDFFYRMFSISNGLFFIISGYFFAKSKDKLKSLLNLFKNYLFFSILIIVFCNLFTGGIKDIHSIQDIFFRFFILSEKGVGILYIIKYFIYFFLLMLLLLNKNFKIKLIIIFIFLINIFFYINNPVFSNIHLQLLAIFKYFLIFFSGYIINYLPSLTPPPKKNIIIFL